MLYEVITGNAIALTGTRLIDGVGGENKVDPLNRSGIVPNLILYGISSQRGHRATRNMRDCRRITRSGFHHIVKTYSIGRSV